MALNRKPKRGSSISTIWPVPICVKQACSISQTKGKNEREKGVGTTKPTTQPASSAQHKMKARSSTRINISALTNVHTFNHHAYIYIYSTIISFQLDIYQQNTTNYNITEEGYQSNRFRIRFALGTTPAAAKETTSCKASDLPGHAWKTSPLKQLHRNRHNHAHTHTCTCTMCNIVYLGSPPALYFLGSLKKKCFFFPVFLHSPDVYSWRCTAAVEINKYAALPTCNSSLQVPFWFWLIEGAGGEKNQVLAFVSVFDAMVSIFLALIFGRPLLFHFCTHEGRSQHSVAECCWHTNQNCTFYLEDLPAQCKHAKAFFPSNALFFAECRPDGVRKYGKMRRSTENYGNFRPVWTRADQKDFFQKNALFFHVRPSISQSMSKLFQQLTPQDQGHQMCSNPVYLLQKCHDVQIFARQLIAKSKPKFYISTRTVDPKLFKQEVLVVRLGLNDVWGCLIQHQRRKNTTRTHDLAW